MFILKTEDLDGMKLNIEKIFEKCLNLKELNDFYKSKGMK